MERLFTIHFANINSIMFVESETSSTNRRRRKKWGRNYGRPFILLKPEMISENIVFSTDWVREVVEGTFSTTESGQTDGRSVALFFLSFIIFVCVFLS